ncbi:MAG: hypothetical protein DRJ10_14540 [Bacteroidetes bacterium]|nr:MAG: hypothetical protein DRJ10_14540 [Bacteroidota bacterium]
MKNVFITLLALVSIALISSCTKSPAENIVGEWKITDIQTSYEVPEDQMEAYNEALNGMKESSKMIYMADGTYEKTISEETTTGKWKISEDGKKLMEQSEDGTNETVNITELTDNKLITVSELDDTQNTMTFEKVK